jgi:hypothetical protein
MPERRASDLFRIRTHFLRSAHLGRDFDDPAALSGYVLTDFARECLRRVAHGLPAGSGQRAWRITGDYGSGKSCFALLLAHAFSGQLSGLPRGIGRAIDYREIGVPRPHLLPALATCSRQPLGTTILQSIRSALIKTYGPTSTAPAARQIDRLLRSKQEPTEEQTLDAILKANRKIISDSKGGGLLIVLDELGKFLEFAANHPDRQDVYLLQRLAEVASRSGDEPLFAVCILHQGFNAYADLLNQTAQREWEKVAGRFEEIVFNQPIEQVAHLIAAALNVKTEEAPRAGLQLLKDAMAQTIDLGWFGIASRAGLLQAAPHLFPLHPTVLPVLIRVFRRFGQNERSLFSFLLSNEPFGLRAFANSLTPETGPYRLHNFYDYVRANLSHRFGAHSYRSHWNLIDSVIESFAAEDELQINILKTVGVLNLLNDADLAPSPQAVIVAISGNPAEQSRTHCALDRLRRNKRILYERGNARGLCLWPHTSVDLEKAYDDACRAVETPQHVANLITDFLEPRPIVARRHYIETGNLRHWDVRYCAVTELDEALQRRSTDSDGTIVVPLCESSGERQTALRVATRTEMKDRPDLLIAIPQPLNNLSNLLQEAQRWEWVLTNTPELNADKYAREEASRQRTAAEQQLQKRIRNLLGWNDLAGEMSLEWFHRTRPLRLQNSKHLLETLSRICNDIYTEAPCIHNELVNRRSLSSAAAAARMRLIERMFTNGADPLLGLDPRRKPPEMSMYLSVLKSTGLHQRSKDSWEIAEPSRANDRLNVLPALRRIQSILRAQTDSRVNTAILLEELRKPPYGVRDGIIPLLLTAFAIAHDREIAIYKDGSFLRELSGEHMLVLTKAPARFDFQYCKIEGVRAQLFQTLLTLLDIEPSKDREAELLDVVKKLCAFVAQLPNYVLNTKRLPHVAMAVRDTILNAREPVKLIFTSLPKACGLDRIGPRARGNKSVHSFVRTLKNALDDLRACYPRLQERIKQEISNVFDLSGPFQQSRAALGKRAQQLLLTVTDTKIRAMCLRLTDDTLPESPWLESVGSLLALKPPSKWYDADEENFSGELAQLATRFRRVESIAFVRGQSSAGATGVRLAITQANGAEQERVVYFSEADRQGLLDLQARFHALLVKNRRLALVAASHALWNAMEQEEDTKDD